MPSRYSRYDTDEERLPDGMTRVGYDADAQVYTFQDADGSYWESAPGCQYGQLTRVGGGRPDGPDDNDDDDLGAPFLKTPQPAVSWRHDLKPLLNFGMLIGLCLLGLFWYLHWAAAEPAEARHACAAGDAPVTIRPGDTCWALARARRIDVAGVLDRNQALDCDRLAVGASLCLPLQR